MALGKRINLIVIGRVWQVIGFALYLSGAVIAISVVISGHKVSKIRPFSQTILALLAIIAVGLLALCIVRLGRIVVLRGKTLMIKAKALKMEELLANDEQPIVLYLRSFSDDQITSASPTVYDIQEVALPGLSTEEEHLARAVRDAGSLLALDKPLKLDEPPDRLALVGAVRISFDEDSWKEKVTSSDVARSTGHFSRG